MRVGGVGVETLVLYFIYGIGTILEECLLDIAELIADHDGFELYAECVGELTPFGEKFEADIGHVSVVVLAVNYEIVFVGHVDAYFIVVSLWCGWR